MNFCISDGSGLHSPSLDRANRHLSAYSCQANEASCGRCVHVSEIAVIGSHCIKGFQPQVWSLRTVPGILRDVHHPGLGPQTQAQSQCVWAVAKVPLNAPIPSSATASGLGATSPYSWAERRRDLSPPLILCLSLSLSRSRSRSRSLSLSLALSLYLSLSLSLSPSLSLSLRLCVHTQERNIPSTPEPRSLFKSRK